MARRVRDNRPFFRQGVDLRAKYPGTHLRWKCGQLTWIGELQPNPLCDTYTVQIVWDGVRRPTVHVLQPQLRAPEGKRLPHVFPGDELCLHLREEWTPDMSIADTIIPWASEWLYFYELWLVTEEWHGGGHEGAPKVA